MLVGFSLLLHNIALVKRLIGKSSLINSLLDTPELAIQVRNRYLNAGLD